MALHRDIYWVGRQWAVTGFGLQAVDQRLQGTYDIEAARLWDEGLSSHIRDQDWVNGDDFDKALTTARRRFPPPAPKSVLQPERMPEAIRGPGLPDSPPAMSASSRDGVDEGPPDATLPAEPVQLEPTPPLQLRVQGALARFIPQWRVRR